MDVTDGVGPLGVGVTDGFGPAVDKNVKKKKSIEGLKLNFLSTNKGRKESQGTKAYRGGETQTERYSKKIEVLPVHYFHQGKNIICNNGYKLYRYEG